MPTAGETRDGPLLFLSRRFGAARQTGRVNTDTRGGGDRTGGRATLKVNVRELK